MKYFFYLLASILLMACGGAKQNDNKALNNKTLLESRIDSLLNRYYEQNGPGVAILITYKGEKIINKCYGLRDIAAHEAVTPTTNFRSGSLAKQFTAMGILSLVEQGKLNLTDTVYDLFPYPIFKNITIEHLISHRSGIEDIEYVFSNNWSLPRFANNDDVLDWYAKNNLTYFTPGSKFEYNNGAYNVLAKIIELKTGITFRDYMQRTIFDAVGMQDTKFIDMKHPGMIHEKAICYQKDGSGHWKDKLRLYGDNLVGAGGIYTNLNDYYTYVEALRNRSILSKALHELIFKPISGNIELHSEDMRMLKGKASSYAMGWEVFDDMAVSAGLYYGVNNWAIFEFNRPLTIVVLTNNNILFREKLVDNIYAVVDEYIKDCCR